MVNLVPRRDGNVVVYTVLFLFFFQLIREFLGAIYAFGLLGTSIPPEIASIALLLSPLVLLFWPREMKRHTFLALTFIILSSRVIAVLLDTRGRMLLTGVGVAASLVWLPSLLWRCGHEDAQQPQRQLSFGLMIAVLLLILFRVLGGGLDLSTHGPYQLLGWLLAALAAFFVRRQARDQGSGDGSTERAAATFGQLALLALGMTSALILLYFAFTSPNVVARWTGAGYPAVIIALALGVVLFVALGVLHPWAEADMGLLWVLNGLFVLTLVTTVWSHQIRFPGDAGGYPFYAPDISLAQKIPLYLMLLLWPVIFVDFALYAQETVSAQPSLRTLGGAFGLSALYLVLMLFGHVFTTVYDYIPVIGAAFRDRFWLVHLVAGLGLVLPLVAVRRTSLSWKLTPAWGGTLAFLALLTVGAVFITMGQPGDAVPRATLTVLTYNIQQGYSKNGQKSADDQLALMRAADADIIGLQESDTNRIAGGNADLVRYYANALDMYSYYGPTTVAGTFGIALLSKVPIENPRTFYMFSEGEQTAAIEAQITADQETYHIYVTHLGNGGPIVQQEAVVQVVSGKENVILMGDFNFRPDTEQYELTTGVLDDAWLRRWPDGTDDRGAQPSKRIDHFFISSELHVEDVRYIDSPASDHPAVTAILRP
ncbi:MAG: endonuclease/exonuclease/phosphatase family protein [Anaerolineae bacterium]|nr:endonuclease/exonuclease/phosphatase family protein [Anaerolineae bacterium]